MESSVVGPHLENNQEKGKIMFKRKIYGKRELEPSADLSVQSPKRKHEFSASNLSLGLTSYHVRHTRK